MDSKEFKDRIFIKRPRYANIYKELIESIANKGNRKTEYTQFGPIYQLFIYAFFIGIHRNERISLPKRESTSDFLEIGKWKPDSLVHFILMTIFSRLQDLEIESWNELEDMPELDIDNFIKRVITIIEEYTNAGLSYLNHLFNSNRDKFNETFVFADILKDVIPDKVREDIKPSEESNEKKEISISELIEKGESPELEFKSTLRYCLKQKSPQKYVEHSAMKTIAAFLNSKGGTLLIGVEDNKNIIGLENDFNTFKKDKDKIDEFQKHLDNLIEKYLGNHVYDLLQITFPKIEESFICKIDVKPASTHKILKNVSKNNMEEFYIRRSASTIKLEPSEMLKYIEEHW